MTGIWLPFQQLPVHSPRRVVSLVPSITESLFDLGFGSSVVGITDFCIHPEHELKTIPRVGGPKNPRVEDILALHPDVVFANQEENDQESIKAISAAGIPVWISFPKTVEDVISDLWELAGLYHSDIAYLKLKLLDQTVDAARLAAQEMSPIRYFCPIWQGSFQGKPWWMTFNQDTYSHHLLELFGGFNIFAERIRKYPLEADLGLAMDELAGERDTRYPRVTLEEVLQNQPEIILLPSEPYVFDQRDEEHIRELLNSTPAVQNNRIFRIDGTLITWFGTRLARAISELPSLFQD